MEHGVRVSKDLDSFRVSGRKRTRCLTETLEKPHLPAHRPQNAGVLLVLGGGTWPWLQPV